MRQITVTRFYILAMAVVLVFIAYMSFTQPVASPRPKAQDHLYTQVPTAIVGPPPTAHPTDEGKALAYIRIPRFGKDWLWTVLEGVSDATLAQGPGHYPGTPLFGEKGNSAIAGHRAGHGDPFIDFDQLRPGDQIILAQNKATWTYTVRMAPVRVPPTDTDPIQPLSGKWLTLTTCWPKYGNAMRLYVHAELTDVTRK